MLARQKKTRNWVNMAPDITRMSAAIIRLFS
jgi:hypothetical protein